MDVAVFYIYVYLYVQRVHIDKKVKISYGNRSWELKGYFIFNILLLVNRSCV
jgi:hypothetical protein